MANKKLELFIPFRPSTPLLHLLFSLAAGVTSEPPESLPSLFREKREITCSMTWCRRRRRRRVTCHEEKFLEIDITLNGWKWISIGRKMMERQSFFPVCHQH